MKPESSREAQEFGLAVGQLSVLRIDSCFHNVRGKGFRVAGRDLGIEICVGSLGERSREAAGTCPACACGDLHVQLQSAPSLLNASGRKAKGERTS